MPNILKKPSDTKLDTDCLKRHKACDSEENYSFTDIRVLTVKYHTVCVCVCVSDFCCYCCFLLWDTRPTMILLHVSLSSFGGTTVHQLVFFSPFTSRDPSISDSKSGLFFNTTCFYTTQVFSSK